MFLFQRFLEARSGTFSVLQGREQLAALSFWAGADGVVPGRTSRSALAILRRVTSRE